MGKLLQNIDCEKGITLNSQLVDLLSILDEPIQTQEQNQKIQQYIQNLKNEVETYQEACKRGMEAKYQFVINNAIESSKLIPDAPKEELKQYYFDQALTLKVCDQAFMLSYLSKFGWDEKECENIHQDILLNMKNIDFQAKEGILDLTPKQVRNLYNHMFENGNTYQRITIDNAGKYSSYVGIDGQTYAPQRLEKMVQFAEKHGMKSKINTFMMYCDFPKVLEGHLNNQVKAGQISEKEKEAMVKKSLLDYVQDISSKYADRIDTVDIFNELIYDPVMGEPGFEEENSYHPRKQGWQKYLTTEDLCQMALLARKNMPNTKFTYNDMNWVEPQKRKEMIKIIQTIRKIEKRYQTEGKLGQNETLIDNIGLEAHLSTADSKEEIENAIKDLEEQIGLPIEVTELDCARVGPNPFSKEEIVKQQTLFKKIAELAQKGRISAVTLWSQSDQCSFMNEKCVHDVYASLLDENFQEKDIDALPEIDLQSFNYHTHTALCGHAEGNIKEYIEKAIEGNLKIVGFSDHMPNVMGKWDPHHEMSLNDFFETYIPELKKRKEEYQGKIELKIGLESDYFTDEGETEPTIKQFREKTEPHLDYMILGQHSALARDAEGHMKIPLELSDKQSAQYPIDYALTVVEAIKSGKFAYVAHPDLFLEHRDKIPEEEREIYAQNVKKATEMICETASQYQIPLEVNLASIAAIENEKKLPMKDGTYAYPVPAFWKVAEEKGCQVVVGMDAHAPQGLRMKNQERIAKQLLADHGIQLSYLTSFEPKGIGKEISQKSNLLKTIIDRSKKTVTSGDIQNITAQMLKTTNDVEKSEQQKPLRED